MKTQIYFIIIALLLFGSWKIQQQQIKKAQWLIGTWENPSTGPSRGSIYENWKKTSDTELVGKSYILKEKDTIIFENIRLVQEQGELFYIPTVKNQNNELPVRFALKTISDEVLVFENPEHDFPQIISYTKINADSLVARISGIKNGQERSQSYPMKRIR